MNTAATFPSSPNHALQTLLSTLRASAASEREKGAYFEDLTLAYLRHEPSYRDLYAKVWTYADWARSQGEDARDVGIDLVAQTAGTGEFHAIQCKFFAEDHRLSLDDMKQFFTASGRKPFSHRLIVTTCQHWNEHAQAALRDQQPPVSKIDLHDLENSQIDWARYQPRSEPQSEPANQPEANAHHAAPVLKAQKQLRPHQENALRAVVQGLQSQARGKLIMACGTGKTFTSLKIAETLAGADKRVLFLVPSLALLSQTLTEWTQESSTPLHSFAVCSDSDVGKKRGKKNDDDDRLQVFTHELRYPATTEAARLALEMAKRHQTSHMSVVFSTYHSIDVIHRAQHQHGLADFDLIICDEAHRTTGAIFEGEDESPFVRVHDSAYLRGHKRLYMTATPRIYGNLAKASAERDNVALCSMDDPALYGPELHVLTFSEAVARGLLVDYKVMVLAVDEHHVSQRIQGLLKDDNNQLRVDDAARIIGSFKALSKQGLALDPSASPGGDGAPMRRAVAFCQVIEVQKGAKVHKVSSKNIANLFAQVVQAYQASEQKAEQATPNAALSLRCEAEHVDGGMSASEKEQKLDWLKAPLPDNTCRILSNVRCLSEGVDVPALDAVLFLTPRNSPVDVVQSVGRVMRNAPGKTRGYVILPVVIPAGVEPHEALNDNKTYAVVWQVLQALRSHDDRFDAMVNKLDLIGADPQKMEVIAISDKVGAKRKPSQTGKTDPPEGGQGYSLGQNHGSARKKGGGLQAANGQGEQQVLHFEIGEIERAIYAKLVQKCGNRHHWEEWASDIAKIAQTHISRISAIVSEPAHHAERSAFNAFATELRDDLNHSISDTEVIEMLAQHLITRPVFEALFNDYPFAQHNPISRAMQRVLDLLHQHRLDKETDTLDKFYASVKLRAAGITSAAGKQKIIVELYDKFFRNAFPKMTERLGIVYTPVEVVDFILHSVNHLLQNEFGQTLGSRGVHIIDPFTGTGTFITRLLQSGLITPEQLPHKYRHEIHANEMVLLAYYIAAINIEAAYHAQAGGAYTPFEGICLTDTFQMYEKEDLVDALLVDNSARRKRQKKLDIRVIVGNPPYSIGQKSENDDAANIDYPHLDARIRNTYAARSKATLAKGLYDSYIRAIRWASDRVGNSGVIGFVCGSGFMEKPAMDGLRHCLVNEFSNLYLINLRGDIRKNMLSKGRAQEGQNIFGSNSMTGIAIAFLVKNPAAQTHGNLHYFNIGDGLSREEKLEKISSYASVAGINAQNAWQRITPDAHGDWLSQRDSGFSAFVPLGDKKNGGLALFENFSLGVITGRDAWCYNASKKEVADNMHRMMEFYNAQAEHFHATFATLDRKAKEAQVDGFIDLDPARISWTHNVKQELLRNRRFTFDAQCLTSSLYRPFTKQWLYFNRQFNERVYQMPRIFPQANAENLVICVSGVGARSGFSALITDTLPCLDTIEKGQCFPLYLYDETAAPEPAPAQDSFTFEDSTGAASDTQASASSHATTATTTTASSTRREALTDAGLAHFHAAYPGETISKQDVFYYVYGLLHSPDYRERYADNLAKELPRIPCVSSAADFWAFSHAGRALADLHLNYESAPLYPLTIDTGTHPEPAPHSPEAVAFYRVDKMRYGKQDSAAGKKEKDLGTVHYNPHITVRGIPLAAYDYVVNGKPALDWVIERQAVKTDKDSGIRNDANAWANEVAHNPRYPLELLARVVTVSLETQKIVRGLPVPETMGA